MIGEVRGGVGKRTHGVGGGVWALAGGPRRIAAPGVAAGVAAGVLLATGGCVPPRAVRPPPPPPAPRPFAPPLARSAPLPASPFADSPVSFTVHGAFARGEQVIVRVCLNPDRTIASSQIVESSGDRRFDELAVGWARRVRLRSLPNDGAPLAACGAVRVELRETGEPALIRRADNLLG